jgi:hypothetical protein
MTASRSSAKEAALTKRAEQIALELGYDDATKPEWDAFLAGCRAGLTEGGKRSPQSYETEIRLLSKRLSDECKNSLRLAQLLGWEQAEKPES